VSINFVDQANAANHYTLRRHAPTVFSCRVDVASCCRSSWCSVDDDQRHWRGHTHLCMGRAISQQ